jgi:hypothetical protein
MPARRLSAPEKLRLAVRVWLRFLSVNRGMRRYPLPDLVKRLSRTRESRSPALESVRLGRVVARSLRIGGHQPRCLTLSLILYSLLRERGDRAELIIGLADDSADKTAHAWVELNGIDVGPPPGRCRHAELARYG